MIIFLALIILGGVGAGFYMLLSPSGEKGKVPDIQKEDYEATIRRFRDKISSLKENVSSLNA
ncbi:MAG: DUF5312 domain-containing protein, partial [Candidatus Omnitrophica bacterium]|nr:DUF5312 domain-containing protein [Candidatus Omnitrophota bacterium]